MRRTAAHVRWSLIAARLLLASRFSLFAILPLSQEASAQDSIRPAGIAGRAQLNPNDDIAFRAMALPDTVWVGQQATYQVGVFLSDAIRGRLRRNPVFVPPELRSMLAYDLASINSVPRYAGSRRFEVHVFQRALFPLTAGRHEIPPARLEYALPLSSSFFAREESHSARTQSLAVIAREPPLTGRPAGYRGAVGWLSIQTRSDRRPQRTGDPFTFTAVVLGTGNVSLLPRPDLAVAWADVVPGAVRVQMDSSTTLVRGRKEFDWILTPVRPGRQAVPRIRYPFFNPYTEKYEVAISRGDSVTVRGDPVESDRSATDSTPVLAIRRTYEGQVPAPITDSAVFWFVMAAATMPLVFLSVGRRQKPVAVTPPEVQLRNAARDAARDPAVIRRIFSRAVAERVNLTAAEMTNEASMRRALRRAGVSDRTAREAVALLTTLDASVFGAGEPLTGPTAEKAMVLLRSIDEEARSRAAIAARTMERRALGTLLLVLMATTAWAAAQDIVASTVFSNGLAAYDAREFGSARQAFFELAQARPRAADAWYNFGAASWQLEDTAAAIVGWQRAMRLSPASSDARSMLRLGPGTPTLWHGVPPVSITVMGIAGGSLWVAGFLLLAIARRRSRVFFSRMGGTLAACALLVLFAGIRQREILSGREAGVVLSPARLRAMPVLSSEAGIETQPGEVVRILGQQGAWMRIELSDKRRGWIEAQRLQALEQAQATFSISR